MTSGTQGGYAPLRRLVRPYILRRLKTDKSVIADLPDETEVNAYCLLSKRKAALYQQSVDEMRKAIEELSGIERRGRTWSGASRRTRGCRSWYSRSRLEAPAST